MTKRQRQIWVDEEFHRELKRKSRLHRKSMLQITRELEEQFRSENEEKES